MNTLTFPEISLRRREYFLLLPFMVKMMCQFFVIRSRVFWMIFLFFLLPSQYALAQYRGPISQNAPSFSLDTPTSYENTPFTPPVEHAVPEWAKLQKKWNKYGVGILIDYTSESAMALNGGHGGSAGYAHQIGAELDLDWEKLIGWSGFKTHAVVINRAGHNLAADFGDRSLNGFQEIYGGGGNVGVKLVFLYGTQDLWQDRLQIAVGKMPVNIDFSTSPLFCTFMNKSICGNPKSLTRGDPGFGTYPGSTYATRIRVWPLHGIYFQAGVYGTNPDLASNAYDRAGYNFSTNRYTGVYISAELGLIPSFGKHNLVGHYKFGVAYDTANYSNNFLDINGNALALTGKKAQKRNGKTQVWLEGDQMIIRNGNGPLHGFYIMAGLIRNDPETAPYLYQYYVGAVNRGFLKSRPKDMLGIVMTRATASPGLVATQKIRYAAHQSLPGNATFPQSHLTMLEVSYSIHVWDGISIQPDYQLILRPNLQKDKKSISAFGFRLHAVL